MPYVNISLNKHTRMIYLTTTLFAVYAETAVVTMCTPACEVQETEVFEEQKIFLIKPQPMLLEEITILQIESTPQKRVGLGSNFISKQCFAESDKEPHPT